MVASYKFIQVLDTAQKIIEKLIQIIKVENNELNIFTNKLIQRISFN